MQTPTKHICILFNHEIIVLEHDTAVIINYPAKSDDYVFKDSCLADHLNAGEKGMISYILHQR